MMAFGLVAVSLIMKLVAGLFFLCSVLLVLIILIQKGRGGGLSGAFGGGMASGVLGSKTGDFLTWVTIVLVAVFLLLSVLMAKFYKPSVSDFGAQGHVVPASAQRGDVNQAAPGAVEPEAANTDGNLPVQ